MRIRKINEEVLYTDEKITTVNYRDIDRLKKASQKNIQKKIRLCAHKDVDDRLHEMLIIHSKDTYVRPHKHFVKSESFHIIEGRTDVIIYDDHGIVTQVIELGEYESNLPFFYRLDQPMYHTIMVRSEVVVFHEVTNGPFRIKDAHYAPWSPEVTDSERVRSFMRRQSREVAQLKSVRK